MAGWLAENWSLVDLPVARVEYSAVRSLDQESVPLGNGVRQRDIGQLERSNLKARIAGDDIELNLPGKPLLFELFGDQARGERCGVERRLQVGGKVRNGADMVLVPVGQDNAGEAVPLAFDELEVRKNEIDARVIGVGESEAEVDHQPFALRAVEIDVHADLARSAERAEQQLFAWSHLRPTQLSGAAGSTPGS